MRKVEFRGGAASVLGAARLSVWRRRQRQQRVLRPGAAGGGGDDHNNDGSSSRSAPVHSAPLPWSLVAGTTAQHTRLLLHYCPDPEDKKKGFRL